MKFPKNKRKNNMIAQRLTLNQKKKIKRRQRITIPRPWMRLHLEVLSPPKRRISEMMRLIQKKNWRKVVPVSIPPLLWKL
jgi:hypothetical protein